MNAQKYTQKSLEAIQLAQNIALERGNVQIEEAHLLSALLAQEGQSQSYFVECTMRK